MGMTGYISGTHPSAEGDSHCALCKLYEQSRQGNLSSHQVSPQPQRYRELLWQVCKLSALHLVLSCPAVRPGSVVQKTILVFRYQHSLAVVLIRGLVSSVTMDMQGGEGQ